MDIIIIIKLEISVILFLATSLIENN